MAAIDSTGIALDGNRTKVVTPKGADTLDLTKKVFAKIFCASMKKIIKDIQEMQHE